ncbi:unnamed protein product [Chrysoparadoxa australica]
MLDPHYLKVALPTHLLPTSTHHSLRVTCGGGTQLPANLVQVPISSNGKPLSTTARPTTLMIVPGLGRNLLSANKLAKEGISTTIGTTAQLVRNNDGTTFPLIERENLYELPVTIHWEQLVPPQAMLARQTTAMEWHKRLGHCSPKSLRLLANTPGTGIKLSDSELKELSSSNRTQCVTCITCKSTHRPRNTKPPRSPATQPLERVHCDIWGPAKTTAIGNVKYLIVFSCEATRFKRVYGLTSKDNAHLALRAFQMHYAAPNAINITYLRSDSEAVFTGASSLFMRACMDFGIRVERSPPYVKNSNGKAERDWRSIIEMARCSLADAPHLPKSLWLEAAMHASYTLCMLPLDSLQGVSPQTKFLGKTPNLSFLRPFGCTAFVRLEDNQRDGKLSPVTSTGYLVGYDYDCPTYRIFKPHPSGKGGTIISSKHVTFLEGIQQIATGGSVTTYPIPSALLPPKGADDDDADDYYVMEGKVPQTSPDLQLLENIPHTIRDHNSLGQVSGSLPGNMDAAQLPAHTTRQGTSYGTSFYCHTLADHSIIAQLEHAFLVNSIPTPGTVAEPTSIQEALGSPQAAEWRAAMNEEVASLKANNTWHLVPAPPGANIIKTKWVFKVKYTAEGSIARYKARLVVQGFTQRLGIDYSATHAPVSRLTTIRLVLALATHHDWEIYALDIKCAYLQAPVHEDLYIRPPQGYDPSHDSQGTPLVGKLNKSLYGLKQAGLNWFTEFTAYLASLGFVPLHSDQCVFLLPSSSSSPQPRATLVLYVDDIILTGPDTATLHQTRRNILTRFEGSDLGDIRLYMGIRFQRTRSKHRMALDQAKYIQDTLTRFHMADCNSAPIPALPHSSKELGGDSEPLQPKEVQDFQALTGALIWLVVCTRPDIAYPVSLLSRAVANPTKAHAGLGKRILRYLKGTINKALTYDFSGYRNNTPALNSYVDADFAESPDRRSTTGYLHMLGPAAIAWGSKRQTLVTKSTAEAEYVALSYAGSDSIHFGRLLSELTGTPHTAVQMFEDNKSAIAIAQGTVQKPRTKHIDVHYHWLRDRVAKGDLSIVSIATDKQLADLFTKSLPRPAFSKIVETIMGPKL